MSAKQFVFDADARHALERGVSVFADAVKLTLGPKGRNALLNRPFGSPVVTNDGVTIAQEIELGDHFENMGAQLIKEVASKTNDLVGDGTTTATVLAQAMVREGLRHVTSGSNPQVIKRGIEQAVNTVLGEMRFFVEPVDSPDKIAQIAGMSANDVAIGRLIADAMEAVGADGAVSVEESRTLTTELTIKTGMVLETGYVSPYMVTDSEHMVAALADAYVLVTDRKITAIADILPLLDKLVADQRPLLIVAEDVAEEALATLVVNCLRGTFRSVAVKAPGYGERRTEALADIAVLTGATVISGELGLSLARASIAHLGRAKSVTVSREDTTIVEGGGAREAIDARIASIRRSVEQSDDGDPRDALRERLARLSSGVAVIEVGAATETELKEKKFRVADAISATRAAIAEGMIPGGGSSLVHATASLDDLLLTTEGFDERLGIEVVRRSLEAPLRQIAQNAGFEGAVQVARIKQMRPGHGFDAMTGGFVDMMEAGIVEPFKVTRCALESAASIGGLLLTTSVLVADEPEIVRETVVYREPARAVKRYGAAIATEISSGEAPDQGSRGAPPEGRKTDRSNATHTVQEIFYATDRERIAAGTYRGRRRDRADESMYYGRCEVSIPYPEYRKVGELNSPRKILFIQLPYDSKRHVVLQKVEEMSPDDFFTKLTPEDGDSAFVFVHGYRTSFEDGARRTAQIAHDLKFPGAAILYSWPSGATFGAYPADEGAVIWTQAHLKSFLTDLATRTGVRTIHVITHSMGSRAVCEAVAQLAATPSAPRLKTVIFAAADVDSGVFAQRAKAMIAQSDVVTLYASAKDTALKASREWHDFGRAGDAAAPVIIPGITTIDATEMHTDVLGHGYFSSDRSVLGDIEQVLRGVKLPRFGLNPVPPDEPWYWRFQP